MRINIQNNYTELVECSKEQIKEVRQYLRIKNEQYFFMRKHNPYAPEYFYLMTENGKFLTGLLPYVLKQLKQLEISYHFNDLRTNLVPFESEHYNYFADDTLRDYQSEAVQAFNKDLEGLYWPRGYYDGAVNSGKQYIIGGLLVNVPANRNLILIHKQELKKQLQEYLSKVFDVGLIHQNRMDLNNTVVIGMYKTVVSRYEKSPELRKYLSGVQTLIVDECHNAQGNEYGKLITKIGAGQRFFLSGSPLSSKDDLKKLKMIGLCGSVVAKRTNQQNIKEGVSNPVRVLLKSIKTPKYYDYETSYKDGVVSNEDKIKCVIDYVTKNPDRQILVAVKLIEHGNLLFDALKSHCNVRRVYGDTFNREQLLEDFKNGLFQVAVTTVWKEGINAGIDSLIYCAGNSDRTHLEQYIGRILRKAGNADVSEVLDFEDTGCKYLEKHFKNREKYYISQGFEIKRDEI